MCAGNPGRIFGRLAALAGAVIALTVLGCDEPPDPPQPKNAPPRQIDIDKKYEELDQAVDDVEARAKQRVDKARAKLPDTGDASAQSD